MKRGGGGRKTVSIIMLIKCLKHVHIYMHTPTSPAHFTQKSLVPPTHGTCMHTQIHTHACMHARKHTSMPHARTHARSLTHTHMRMYVHMHAYAHICAHRHTCNT